MSYVMMNYREPENERLILEQWELYENQRLSSGMFKLFINSMFTYAVEVADHPVWKLHGEIDCYARHSITSYYIKMEVIEMEAGCYSAFFYVNNKFIRRMVISE